MVTDQSVFMRHDEMGRLVGMLVVYVDDIIAVGIPDAVDSMYTVLSCRVLIKQVGELGGDKDVVFLGFKYMRSQGGFIIDPSEYVSKILRAYGMDTCKSVSTPGTASMAVVDGDERLLSKEERRGFRRVVGQLLW